MNVSIDYVNRVTPEIRQFIGQISGPGRGELIRAAAVEVQHITVEHLRGLAATRHKTAGKLGATPSNHLAQAAEKVAVPSAVSVISGDGVTAEAMLTFNHPGLSRAFGAVTIVPTEAKALTIPIHALAYNRRAGQIPGLFRPEGKNILAIMEGTTMVPLYALVRKVTQPQDRTLLPTAEEWAEAAARGINTYIAHALEGLS